MTHDKREVFESNDPNRTFYRACPTSEETIAAPLDEAITSSLDPFPRLNICRAIVGSDIAVAVVEIVQSTIHRCAESFTRETSVIVLGEGN